MPDTTSTGPPVPMLELTAVRWLLAELAGDKMTLAEAGDYAARASTPARAVLGVLPAKSAQLPGEVPFPLPAADQ
jgi:hypothetical protein